MLTILSATLGARMLAGAARSKSVGLIILAGDEFPLAPVEQFEEWNMTFFIHRIEGATSTRGVLEYLDLGFGRTVLISVVSTCVY